jgi:RimJ/RimL family protein N-acetyltransferase
MRVIDVTLNEFNEIANDPEVLAAINPFVDRIDLAWAYQQPGTWCKGVDGVRGCALIIPWPDNAREIHWFFPGYGGMRAIRTIVDWVFENTNTDILFGNTPKQNLGARIVNRWLGGKIVGELVDDHGRPAVTFSLAREEWANHKKPVNLTDKRALLI